MTRWRGGFAAVGAVVATGDTARSPVWVSTDGAHWRSLAPEVLGPAALVIGIAGTKTGLVALTLQGGVGLCDPGARGLDCWTPAGPLQSWTSADGATWAAHPGPAGFAPAGVDCGGCGVEVPSLYAGTPGLLVVNRSGAIKPGVSRLTLSSDGIAWRPVPPSAFPATFEFGDIEPFGSGFIAAGNSGGDHFSAIAMTSADGLHWVSHSLPTLKADRSLGTAASRALVGPTGVILQGGTGGAPGLEIWWTSATGQSWLRFLSYPPLGVAPGSSTCEAGCAGGPNGALAADGDRILAYRVRSKPAAWTSSDGRTWRALTVSRSRPSVSGNMVLWPIGVMFLGEDDSVWFGQPTT